MRPLVYVAGPYSDDPVGNTRRAITAADQLLNAGIVPYVPHLSMFWDLLHPRPYADWLELDLEVVRRCDAVLRLSGNSPGADREVAFAESEWVPVLYSVDETIMWALAR